MRARRQQRTHLIAHERHQRAHHQRESLQHERGHLVADGLAGTGGHDSQGIAARQDGLHHAVLPGTERSIAKVGFKRVQRLVIHTAALVSRMVTPCRS